MIEIAISSVITKNNTIAVASIRFSFYNLKAIQDEPENEESMPKRAKLEQGKTRVCRQS